MSMDPDGHAKICNNMKVIEGYTKIIFLRQSNTSLSRRFIRFPIELIFIQIVFFIPLFTENENCPAIMYIVIY